MATGDPRSTATRAAERASGPLTGGRPGHLLDRFLSAISAAGPGGSGKRPCGVRSCSIGFLRASSPPRGPGHCAPFRPGTWPRSCQRCKACEPSSSSILHDGYGFKKIRNTPQQDAGHVRAVCNQLKSGKSICSFLAMPGLHFRCVLSSSRQAELRHPERLHP